MSRTMAGRSIYSTGGGAAVVFQNRPFACLRVCLVKSESGVTGSSYDPDRQSAFYKVRVDDRSSVRGRAPEFRVQAG